MSGGRRRFGNVGEFRLGGGRGSLWLRRHEIHIRATHLRTHLRSWHGRHLRRHLRLRGLRGLCGLRGRPEIGLRHACSLCVWRGGRRCGERLLGGSGCRRLGRGRGHELHRQERLALTQRMPEHHALEGVAGPQGRCRQHGPGPVLEGHVPDRDRGALRERVERDEDRLTLDLRPRLREMHVERAVHAEGYGGSCHERRREHGQPRRPIAAWVFLAGG